MTTEDQDKDYLEVNRSAWNDRTSVHWESDFYSVKDFIAGENSLNDIELPLLGDVVNEKILHLQCHFGQDSISLARAGAKVTGLDISDAAIAKARELNTACAMDCEFVCADVYSAPDIIKEKFDTVFTSYGTIGWLPDMDRWAQTITAMLRPGGRLVFAEFHPMVWMWDEDFERIDFRYFDEGPIVEEAEGTYADRKADIQRKEISWNHGLSEVITALLKAGMQLEHFSEYDYSPYDCFKHLTEFEPGRYRVDHMGDRLPMVYALVAKMT